VSARLRPVVAIDGPAGAGKSTLAAFLAARFSLVNLETGAMYRAFALKALEHEIPLDNADALKALAAGTTIVLEPNPREIRNRVLLDGRDVTARLRDSDVAEAASRVSVHPAVRAWMVSRQRAMGAAGGVVMEGRDIGTHVFPDAAVKIFLDAAPDVRGQRRFLQNPGAERSAAAAAAEVRERDERDRSRAASPLVPAADAVHLDTTAMSLEEVCAAAERLVVEKTGFEPVR
jgi:cytidylate kinase